MMPHLLPPPSCLRLLHRLASSAPVTSAAQQHRLDLFRTEQIRQHTYVRDRVTKLHVHYIGRPEDVTLLMNRKLSTPFDCAAHIQEVLRQRAIVALLDGRPWDMRRPLEPKDEASDECTLELCRMKDANPALANDVFWRSCSVLLGAVLESAFKDEFSLQLCSFPPPNVRSGSFVYDVRLVRASDGQPVDWVPSEQELRFLSCIAQRLALDALPFEPLDIDVGLAQAMFSGSPFKAMQIPAMAAAWSGPGNARLTVYRMGHFVELSRGPLMSHSGQVGRFAITAAHPVTSASYGPLLRFQGVALPPDFLTHFTTFDLLRARAAQRNRSPLPALTQPVPAQEAAEP